MKKFLIQGLNAIRKFYWACKGLSLSYSKEVILIVLFLTEFSLARVGGGDSYGGGRRSGGSSSSGWSSGGSRNYNNDGGLIFELIFWILRLCIRYPLVGIPILLIVIFYFLKFYRKTHSYADYNSGSRQEYPVKFVNSTKENISIITNSDSQFSYPLFKDFVFSLYSHFHEYRGNNKLDFLSSYFSSDILQKNRNIDQIINIDGVVIGNCQIQNVNKTSEYIQIQVYFSANYTEFYKNGKSQRFLLKESWKFRRGLQVKSRAPEFMTALSCPQCGAPLDESFQGKCSRCGESNKNGKFDWYVFEMNTIKDFYIPAQNQNSLLSSVNQEEGTSLPTIKEPGIEASMKLAFKDRKDLEYAHKRFQDIFLNLQKAWSQQNWELARPFESDALFQSHWYWIQDFKRKKEVNYLEQISIEKIVPVALYRDKFYLSFTVRIFASMLDYTKNEGGQIIRGSARKRVHFTEYWTFIKGIGDNLKEAKILDTLNCPSCGAGLKISMAGNCDYCGIKITLGQFDWVLSQIEQDEEFSL